MGILQIEFYKENPGVLLEHFISPKDAFRVGEAVGTDMFEKVIP